MNSDGQATPRTRIGAALIQRAQFLDAEQTAELVNALPASIRDEELPRIVRHACLECFLTSARSLIEYLGVRRDRRDFWAGDMLGTWQPPMKGDAECIELDAYWQLASQQVMHFSKLRTVQADGSWIFIDANSPVINKMADAVLVVWDRFVLAVAVDLDRDPAIAPTRRNLGQFFMD